MAERTTTRMVQRDDMEEGEEGEESTVTAESEESTVTAESGESTVTAESEENTVKTAEYAYTETETTFTKRELREDERWTNIYGKRVYPPLKRGRLCNDYVAIQMLAQETTIPVPTPISLNFHDGALSLTVRRVDGVRASHVEGGEAERAKALAKIDEYVVQQVLPQLRRLRSTQMGSLCETILPSPSLWDRDHRRHYHPRHANEGEAFVFCHGDLAPGNIIVDPQTYDVRCIVDWEYSGFYPPDFERPIWRRTSRHPQPDPAFFTRMSDTVLQRGPDEDFWVPPSRIGLTAFLQRMWSGLGGLGRKLMEWAQYLTSPGVKRD